MNVFSLIVAPAKAFFRSFPVIDMGRSTKDSGLKLGISLVFHEEQYDSPKIVRLVTFSGDNVTNRDEFQRHLHDVGMNSGCKSDIFVINAVMLGKNSLAVLYTHEFQGVSRNKVPGALKGVSTYRFYVGISQALIAIGNRSNECSSI